MHYPRHNRRIIVTYCRWCRNLDNNFIQGSSSYGVQPKVFVKVLSKLEFVRIFLNANRICIEKFTPKKKYTYIGKRYTAYTIHIYNTNVHIYRLTFICRPATRNCQLN